MMDFCLTKLSEKNISLIGASKLFMDKLSLIYYTLLNSFEYLKYSPAPASFASVSLLDVIF